MADSLKEEALKARIKARAREYGTMIGTGVGVVLGSALGIAVGEVALPAVHVAIPACLAAGGVVDKELDRWGDVVLQHCIF